MSESLRQIIGMNLYNAETGQWEQGMPQTVDKAVLRPDGSTVADALDAVPGQIETAIAEVQGGAPEQGNTLGKLHGTISAMQALLQSDDLTLDAVQEIVDYIKANRGDLTLLGQNKVNIDDIVNSLNTVSTVEGKVLDARQGKVLLDALNALEGALEDLGELAEDFVTREELATLAVEAVPLISETPPQNPVDGQIWFKPIGTAGI